METKTCNKCKQDLPLKMFYKIRRGYKNRRNLCRDCAKLYRQGHNKTNPFFKRQKLGHRLKELYNLRLSDYDKMLEQQNNVCAICKQHNNVAGERLGVDHDHETEEIRGLLCNHCNKGLSGFRDNIQTLLEAIKYLTKEG